MEGPGVAPAAERTRPSGRQSASEVAEAQPASLPLVLGPRSLVALQRSIGNQAVVALVQRDLNRVVMPPTREQATTDQPIASMTTAQKLELAIKAAPVGEQLGQRLAELLSPTSLETMAAFGALFVAAQLTPAGWASDIIAGGLVVVSALLIGPEVVDVLQHLASFVSEASGATSQADLDRAGGDFAYAVTHVGVDVVLAILMHEAAGGAGPERPPATQRFGAKVTPDGQVVSVPFDEIPGRANTSMTTPSEGVSGEKGAAAIDTPINVELAELKWDQGHALENHGPQLTLEELEQRVLDQHPEMEQSRTALKFRDEATMKDAINQVLNRDSSKISRWVASPDQPELLLDPLDMGKSIGEGYTNTGTRRAPTSQLVPASEVTKVVVVVRLAPRSPRGWLVRTAYPKWP